MPEYPLLPLPAFEQGDPPKPLPFTPSTPKVASGRQGERLGPVFERLARVLAKDRRGVSLRDDPASIAPERALVLEVAGSLVDFQALVARVDGLEFLGDEEIEFEPDEDFFERDTRKGREGEPRMDRLIGGRLYLAMPDVGALKQLLSLWKQWQRGEKLPRGFTRWRDVFASLREIRPWGPADRLSDETITHWREEVEHDAGEIRRIEAELWYHDNDTSRAAAFQRVEKVVAKADGRVVDVAWFSSINPRHQAYRRAKLEVSALRGLEAAAGVSRSSGQPSDKSVPRGTVWHTVFRPVFRRASVHMRWPLDISTVPLTSPGVSHLRHGRQLPA